MSEIEGSAILDTATVDMTCPVCKNVAEVSGPVGYWSLGDCPHCHSTIKVTLHERDGDDVLVSAFVVHNPKECDECRARLN
jgi:hypothetical protein